MTELESARACIAELEVELLTEPGSAAEGVLEAANPSAKHAWWWTKVYGRGVKSVNIKYCAGRENKNADALSLRPHLLAPNVGIAEDEVQVSIIATKKGSVSRNEPNQRCRDERRTSKALSYS